VENPKSVNRFLLGLLVSVLVLAVGLSLYLQDFSVLLYTLGFILLVLVGCTAVALIFAVEIGPLMWLLSWLSRRRSKRKS
jgi:hypothetical protein